MNRLICKIIFYFKLCHVFRLRLALHAYAVCCTVGLILHAILGACLLACNSTLIIIVGYCVAELCCFIWFGLYAVFVLAFVYQFVVHHTRKKSRWTRKLVMPQQMYRWVRVWNRMTVRKSKPEILRNFSEFHFYARKQLLLLARLSHCNSVCLSVCHTGGSVKNGPSYDHQIFTIILIYIIHRLRLEDSSFRNRKAFP